MSTSIATANATTQGATEKKRIMIPYNAAGQFAFDVFHSVAERMLKAGNEAASDFILANFPGGRTIHKDYADGQLRHVIEQDDGEHVIIIYDYETHDMTAALLVQSPMNDKYLAGARNVKTDSLDLFY